MKNIPPILGILVLMVSGQILSKLGSSFPVQRWGNINPVLMLSYALFLVRGILWAAVLRRTPLFIAYPLTALSYPLVLFADLLFFGEVFSFTRLIGTILVGSGSVLLVLPESQAEAAG